MQIEVLLPRESEAKIEMSVKDGKIIITPFFPANTGNKNVAHLTVKGNKGKERSFNLSVFGRSGRLQVSEFRRVETDFDKYKPDEEPVEEGEDGESKP